MQLLDRKGLGHVDQSAKHAGDERHAGRATHAGRPTSAANSARDRETRRLVELYHRTGDRRARAEAIERLLPLAKSLARRYSRGREPLDDLVQVACVGLVKAVDRFDCDRATSITTYAVPTILGELRRHFRDASWAIHLPRALQEHTQTVDRAVDRMSPVLKRAPTVAELASETGLDPEQVLDAIQAGRDTDVVSLDAPLGAEDDGSRVDTLGSPDPQFEAVDLRSILGTAVDGLDARDRLVLDMRFRRDLTQAEIAGSIGVSQMQVSRILRRSLDQLRSVALGSGEDEDRTAAAPRAVRAA